MILGESEYANLALKTFDYIIIGGGTSGLCLANRLSSDASVTVLVLEAGPANLGDPKILMPASYGIHLGDPKYDWLYTTTKQPNCGNRELVWNRGKCLGGCSAINFLWWSHPSKKDMDAIELLGNPGWNWDSYKKYVNKAEGFAEPTGFHNSAAFSYEIENHGLEGPLRTNYPAVLSGFEDPARKVVFLKMGVENLWDSISGYSTGSGIVDKASTIDNKTFTRSYSASAYYEPISDRKNLTVVVNAHVSEILSEYIVGAKINATGVKFISNDTTYETRLKKEVIISAGAINTPQILELSGIGPRNILEKYGIEVKVELPGVGNNVQDHFFCGNSFEIREEVTHLYNTCDELRDPETKEKHLELHAKREGLYTMSLVQAAFFPVSSLSPEAEEKQRAYMSTIENKLKEGSLPVGLGKQYELLLSHMKEKWPSAEIITFPGFLSAPNPPEPGKKYISLVGAANHLFSRGSIHIQSEDPLVAPLINPNTFSESYDLTTLVETMKYIRRMAKEEPLQSILGKDLNPGEDTQTEEQITDFVKSTANTVYHTIGSASMLPLEDGGVVDPQLRVYGTSNIRVADTSIMPLHVGGHIQALAYVIGEKAADIIRATL